jgi:2-haloacid dehalogenase
VSDVGVDTAAHRFFLLKLSSPRRQTTSWTGLEALRRLAEEYPLVIVTNTDDVHASRLVDNLQAPFEVVITSEQMGVYKPRLRAFEYMLDKLGVAPDETVHVSASPKYDLRSAADMGIKHTVYMDRGFEPDHPWLGCKRITDIADLPVLLGLPRP